MAPAQLECSCCYRLDCWPPIWDLSCLLESSLGRAILGTQHWVPGQGGSAPNVCRLRACSHGY